MSLSFGSTYMRQAHGDLDELARELHRKTVDAGIMFDTLVGTGMSGAIVVPRLAERLGVDWLLVRKPKENTHSSARAEGHLGERWLFVDDLIDSGETYSRVRREVERLAEDHLLAEDAPPVEHAGAFLYDEGEVLAP